MLGLTGVVAACAGVTRNPPDRAMASVAISFFMLLYYHNFAITHNEKVDSISGDYQVHIVIFESDHCAID
jgi:hypothetical protein